jgi:hypothetical protein
MGEIEKLVIFDILDIFGKIVYTSRILSEDRSAQ